MLDSELRRVRNQHIKFVAEAIDVITLLNIAHGFSPKVEPQKWTDKIGGFEVADMAKQLREA